MASMEVLTAPPPSEPCLAAPEPQPHPLTPPRGGASSLQNAMALPVDLLPISPAADGLVDGLLDAVRAEDAKGKTNARRAAGMEKLRRHVGAIVGGVLLNWTIPDEDGKPSLSYRPLQNAEMPLKPLTWRQFVAARDALTALGYLGRQGAHSDFYSDVGEKAWGLRRAERLWPTERLLVAAEEAGVGLQAIREHFRSEGAEEGKAPEVPSPCVLYGLGGAKKGMKARGPRQPWPTTAEALALAEDVAAHNAFAGTFRIEGCPAPAWHRVFTGALDQHGRWYAVGADTYQTMKEEDRLRAITVNGEPVAELDIRASHLSLVYARAGSPLDPEADPYAIPGLPRWVIKAWITATLGDGIPPRRWSRQSIQKAAKKGNDLSAYKLAVVGVEVLKVHPILSRVHEVLAPNLVGHGVAPERLVGLFLMGVEAKALTAAMAFLRQRRGILSLPMHDGLIVPGSAVKEARSALELAVWAHMRFEPFLDAATGSAGQAERVLENRS